MELIFTNISALPDKCFTPLPLIFGQAVRVGPFSPGTSARAAQLRGCDAKPGRWEPQASVVGCSRKPCRGCAMQTGRWVIIRDSQSSSSIGTDARRCRGQLCSLPVAVTTNEDSSGLEHRLLWLLHLRLFLSFHLSS